MAAAEFMLTYLQNYSTCKFSGDGDGVQNRRL